MVNIAKFETLHDNLWDKHGEVEIFFGRSEDNKSSSDNLASQAKHKQNRVCLIEIYYLCVRACVSDLGPVHMEVGDPR